MGCCGHRGRSMAEQLAVEVDVKKTSQTDGHTEQYGQAPLFGLDFKNKQVGR